jgi:phosphoglycolate phosphatase-like HAD superfamily hydrolase
MIKNFIFDIDGTLLDSNDFHARAWHLPPMGKIFLLKEFGRAWAKARISYCRNS